MPVRKKRPAQSEATWPFSRAKTVAVFTTSFVEVHTWSAGTAGWWSGLSARPDGVPRAFSSAPCDYEDCITEAPIDAVDCLVEAKIDFTMLKSWINQCYHEHGGECDSHDRGVERVKLIEISSRHIVDASDHRDPYAALSYVFGTKMPASPDRDKLPENIPRTIKDALQVTLELGLDYLWVDRYCIPQNDEKEKKTQISKMHHIFRGAHVTIIAAAGDGPDYGIPGVSIPWLAQPHVIVDGRLFVGAPEVPEMVAIPKSKWYTRAWTYQEEALSRRTLHFTNYQVLFSCRQTGMRRVEEPIRKLMETEQRPLDFDYRRRRRSYNIPFDSEALYMHIALINSRDISYETDRVNAIVGIFGHMQDKGVLVGHLSGVPILRESSKEGYMDNSWEEGFLYGIAWSMCSIKGRRTEFPSWSWAGWKCSEWDIANYHVRDENIRIWIELEAAYTMRSSSDGVLPKPLKSSDSASQSPELSNSTECLSSNEFQKIAGEKRHRDLICHLIQIEAPILHCHFKRSDIEWRLASVEGHHLDRTVWIGFTPCIPKGSQEEKDLISNTSRCLFFKRSRNAGFIIAVRERLELDYSERIFSAEIHSFDLPFVPQLQSEEGPAVPLFEYGEREVKPEKKVTLRKGRIRLG